MELSVHRDVKNQGLTASCNFSRAQFMVSAHELRDLPADDGREVAFAGRSNTGKSSVINTLCNHKSLARTSRTPGRTQQIVVFEIEDGRRLIDLPGFGYAKVPRKLRAYWGKTIPAYLEKRQSLAGLVLVSDVRHPLKPQEQELIAWCATIAVPTLVLLNKCDKVSRSQARTMAMNTNEMLRRLDFQARVELFSSQTKKGQEEVKTQITGWLTET